MINLHVNLWVFGRTFFEGTKHFVHKVVQLTEHKFVEVQLSYFGISELLSFSLDTHWWGRDHAGFHLTVIFLGLLFDFSIYDHRHWNHEEARWYKPGEEDAEWIK